MQYMGAVKQMLEILLTVIFELHTGVFPGGCRPPDLPHGRAGVLGDPFWIAFFIWFLCFFVLLLGVSGPGR